MSKVLDLTDKKIHLDKSGNADYLEGLEAEEQMIRNTLVTFKNTWFDDLNAGVDWPTILEKGYTLNEFKSEIRRALNRLTFITDIVNINLQNNENREATLSIVVLTETGNTLLLSEVL